MKQLRTFEFKNMNNKLSTILILLLLVAITGYWFWRKQIVSNNVVKIAVILPLTGDYAKIGTDIKNSIEQAKDDAIKDNVITSSQVEFIFEDNKLDPNATISAYNKIKATTKNLVGVFTITSKCILALKPLTNKDKILLINGSAIGTDIEDTNDYCFSVIPNAKIEANYLAEYIFNTLQFKNINAIFRNDQSGQSFNKFFTEKYNLLGGKVLSVETNEPNATDFKNTISKFKNFSDAQGIFMASFGNETALFSKQSDELNYKLPIITYEAVNQPKAIEIGGNSINKIYFASPKFVSTDSSIVLFKERVQKNFNNTNINYYMISHYDATSLLLGLISKGNNTATSIKSGIENIKEYKGLGPTLVFDNVGAVTVEMQMNKFIENKPTIVK
jgi:branched-chain amino acid transport system substrate-binding protein